MGPGYSLIALEFPVVKNDAPFDYMIRRNFATDMEDAGVPVFYFVDASEASECLETLLTQ